MLISSSVIPTVLACLRAEPEPPMPPDANGYQPVLPRALAALAARMEADLDQPQPVDAAPEVAPKVYPYTPPEYSVPFVLPDELAPEME